MESLKRHRWPGNIRELENYIERAVIMSTGKVLNPSFGELDQTEHRPVTASMGGPARTTTLEECEREHIVQALNETHWVVGGPAGAAALLGMKRTTLIWKMQKLGITRKAKLRERRFALAH